MAAKPREQDVHLVPGFASDSSGRSLDQGDTFLNLTGDIPLRGANALSYFFHPRGIEIRPGRDREAIPPRVLEPQLTVPPVKAGVDQCHRRLVKGTFAGPFPHDRRADALVTVPVHGRLHTKQVPDDPLDRVPSSVNRGAHRLDGDLLVRRSCSATP
jgi:hypothetical protein